jgi:uncharacterized delta-60 repeat protein
VVYAVALQKDGKVIIGGAFTNVAGGVRRCVARLNANGSLDSSFNPSSGVQQGFSQAAVYAIAVQEDGEIVIGGDFDTANGAIRYGIARLWPDGSTDTSFNLGLSTSAIVFSLLMQNDGKLIAGGGNSWYVSRYQTNGVPDFSTFMSNVVTSVALQSDGKIIVGGQFKYGVVRLNANGTRDTNFNLGWAGLPQAPMSVAVQSDGRIIAGGSFTSFNGFNRRGVVRLNDDGTMDTSFDPGAGPDGTVRAVVTLMNGACLIGGEFASVDGCEWHGIARLNGDVRIVSPRRAGSAFTASVPTDVGKNYVLEKKESIDASAWSSVSTNGGNGSVEDLSDPSTDNQRSFYRVRVE